MTIEHAFCPSCGHNLGAERARLIGPLAFDPRGDARWLDAAVGLSQSQHILLGSLALAAGAFVGKDVLAERMGTESDHDVVAVQLHRVRRALRAVGAPPTVIQAAKRRGYRLNIAMLESWANDHGKAI